ncbi:MAG: flagellin [Bdellovibrionia bacterium]
MGLRINTNVPSLVAQRHLRTTRSNLDRSFERLSSGLRINHAGDDAAGLAISELLKAQIRGYTQSERNAQDGISVVQIAEGALEEVSNLLIRLRELGVQSASDTLSDNERSFLNIEYQQSLDEINRIANSTQFNQTPLLNGSSGNYDIQIGLGNNPTIDRIRLFESSSADVSTISLGINLSSVSDKLSAQNCFAPLDGALNHVTSVRAQLGAIQNRLQSIVNNIRLSRENLSSANSRIRDMDMAEETTELTKNQILSQSGISILAQANSSVKTALNLLGQGGSG